MPLELPIQEYRICYVYSETRRITVSKIGLDWFWFVTDESELPVIMDTAATEGEAERAAMKYLEGENGS